MTRSKNFINKQIRLACLMLLIVLGPLSIANPYELKEMANRVKPLGRIHVIGQKDDDVRAMPPVQEVALTAKAIYDKFCVACHATGVAGAPKYKDPSSWSKHTKKGLDLLVKNAWTGINAMPPKGTCSICTQVQIRAAIQYMLP